MTSAQLLYRLQRTGLHRNRFLILDWNANYEFANGITAYVTVGNLTNESYDTSYNSWNGLGSSAMPGRYFMVGTKYKF